MYHTQFAANVSCTWASYYVYQKHTHSHDSTYVQLLDYC